MIKKSGLLGAVCASVFSLCAIPSHAALIDIGGGLFYDDNLDITWAQPDVRRDWFDANTWAAGLTLGGATEWRLPYASVAAGAGPWSGNPVDCSSASELACRDNELGYMFYQNNVRPGTTNADLFPTLQDFFYWTGTESEDLANSAWDFDFRTALLGESDKGINGIWTWAVHPGNVSAVPVPAAVWLFGSGLLGLIGIARRKKAA